MKNKTLFLSVAILVVIAIGGYLFPKVGTNVQEKIVERVVELGGVPTLDGVDNPYISISGQRELRQTIPMAATSTVLCTFANPFTATSSIDYVSAEVTGRGSLNQANTLVISTSTTAFATSTTNLVNNFAMGTGQFSLALQKNDATTTDQTGLLNGRQTLTGASRYILGPSERINVVISTTTIGNFGTFGTYMTGTCSAGVKKI